MIFNKHGSGTVHPCVVFGSDWAVISLCCSVVHQLSVQGCGFSSVGTQHISDALCNDVLTCNIRKLNLSDNDMVSESVHKLRC